MHVKGIMSIVHYNYCQIRGNVPSDAYWTQAMDDFSSSWFALQQRDFSSVIAYVSQWNELFLTR